MIPFNTTMRDKLQAALARTVPVIVHKPYKLVGIGRGPNGRFQSLRTVCTNDGYIGFIGTPCARCRRTL